jgi:hypothetical protein
VLAELREATEEELAAVTRVLAGYQPTPMPAVLAARVEQAIAVEADRRMRGREPQAQDSDDDDEQWRERLSKIPPPRPPQPGSHVLQW